MCKTMSKIKSAEDIRTLRELGKRHAYILSELEKAALPGVSTAELNELCERLIYEGGDEPAFKGYTPEGADRAFPAALCVAPNDVVVHGIPNEQPYTLKEGDILGIDIGLVRDGLITDGGYTFGIGAIDENAEKLLRVTREARDLGVAQARAGNRVGDIGHAVEEYVRAYGFGLVRELCGHGVGHEVHEDPQIPNFGKAGTGEKLEEGMVLAIEPMVNEGSGRVRFLKDGYTVRTHDGSRSAHFEHTIVVTDDEPVIITKK